MFYTRCYVALIIMKKEEIISTLEEQKPTAKMRVLAVKNITTNVTRLNCVAV